MGNDSSTKPKPPPPTTEEIALPSRRTPSSEEIKDIDAHQRIQDRIKTQKLARWLVAGLVGMFAALFIFSFFGLGSAEQGERMFPIVQAALFTVLGFVFGNKVSGKED